MVILIILGTAVVTLGGVVRVGPFRNMNEKITKILVGALIIELCAAFIGVFKTLPQLDFYRAQEYRWEIQYNEFLDGWENSLSESDKIMLSFFKDHKMEHRSCLAAFYDFKDIIKQYDNICKTNNESSIEYWKNSLDKLEEKFLVLYIENLDSNPYKINNIQKLIEKFERYNESSGKSGAGTMYVSFKGDSYQGVVTYRFPGVEAYTVLTCNGFKKKNILDLEFIQAASAMPVDNFYIPRPGGSFKVEFTQDTSHPGHYIGQMPDDLGTIRIRQK
jgi:hypothetical protein